MPRRWEPYISPLLARLGLTRPDQNPVPLADEAQAVVLVGNYQTAAMHPGSRLVWITGAITGAAVNLLIGGGLAIMRFYPPTEGGYLRNIFAATEDGSYVTVYTQNQVAFPAGFVPAGGTNTQRAFKPDTREPYPDIRTPDVGAVPGGPGPAGFARTNGWPFPTPIPWWQGDTISGGEQANIIIQGTVPIVGMNVIVEYETPLQGIKRSTPG